MANNNASQELHRSLMGKIKSLDKTHRSDFRWSVYNEHEDSRSASSWSIYKVPERLRNLNEAAYSPLTVSIGPFHSHSWDVKEVVRQKMEAQRVIDIMEPFRSHRDIKEVLQSMEAQKVLYMKSITALRTDDYEKTLKDCGEAVISLLKEARASYAENVCTDDDARLAEILLVDGCFILELFIRYVGNPNAGDLIFESPWMIPALRRDLLLLENQIPFSVLEKLFTKIADNISNNKPQYSLTEYALRFFLQVLNFNEAAVINQVLDLNEAAEGTNEVLDLNKAVTDEVVKHFIDLVKKDTPVKHLLDLVHKCYKPSISKMDPKGKSLVNIQGAVKLRDAGIKFEKAVPGVLFSIKCINGVLEIPQPGDLFSIKFANGVLEIPQLCIDDMTEPLFRNLIAYEQCFPKCGGQITSYAVLMDYLIQTTRDAEVLKRERIILNDLGNSKDVSGLFNSLCKEVAIEDFFFHGLCKKVNEYYGTWWPRTKAIFIRDYFSNPWSFAGVVAAGLILILTLCQTLYTIATYYYQ